MLTCYLSLQVYPTPYPLALPHTPLPLLIPRNTSSTPSPQKNYTGAAVLPPKNILDTVCLDFVRNRGGVGAEGRDETRWSQTRPCDLGYTTWRYGGIERTGYILEGGATGEGWRQVVAWGKERESKTERDLYIWAGPPWWGNPDYPVGVACGKLCWRDSDNSGTQLSLQNSKARWKP